MKRGNSFFRGCNIILINDFFQLPPVCAPILFIKLKRASRGINIAEIESIKGEAFHKIFN